jgi:AraC family transcriptional regulator of adaptative response/methylated-DNA-[protein]-cysteine methyltransferase
VKHNLLAGHNVTTALYAAGYGSSSRLYERTAAQLGMTPEKYRRGAVASIVRYTIADSPLGRMLIAATDKGICSIQFADRLSDTDNNNDNDNNNNNDEQLQQGLMREFPFARRRRDDQALQPWKENLERLLRGQETDFSLPLDIRATAFQRRVWEALQEIPRGETRSYSAMAEKIGMPKATRAVARACATNPVAVVIPCHRVVRQDGNRGGYRWGVERKEQLLALERQQPGRQQP